MTLFKIRWKKDNCNYIADGAHRFSKAGEVATVDKAVIDQFKFSDAYEILDVLGEEDNRFKVPKLPGKSANFLEVPDTRTIPALQVVELKSEEPTIVEATKLPETVDELFEEPIQQQVNPDAQVQPEDESKPQEAKSEKQKEKQIKASR